MRAPLLQHSRQFRGERIPKGRDRTRNAPILYHWPQHRQGTPQAPLCSTSLHMSEVELQLRDSVTRFVAGDPQQPLSKAAFFERLAQTPEHDLPASQVLLTVVTVAHHPKPSTTPRLGLGQW
jgi:hypothetical protein